MTQETKPTEWVLTDVDTGQYGKRISKTHFIFKEDGRDEKNIVLPHYTREQIESCINTYGYTLIEGDIDNIVEKYGKEANWIIAECLFEMNI